MAEVYPDICTFWSLVVNPGAPQEAEFPDTSYLTITNACLPEVDSKSDSPVRLFANVVTEDLAEPNKITETNTLIATLIPGKIEQQSVSVVFSPFNKVSLEVKGEFPVHLVGQLTLIDTSDFEEYEEEEEEEEEAKEEVKEEGKGN